MAPSRRLAAIVFTDIEGFTALANLDERAALHVLEEQDGLVRPILAAHHGRKIKSMGDGLLIEFPNARDAVEGAVDLQRSVHEHNSKDGARPLRIRIGIHVGDVEDRGEDILGDAVNIASRIEPLADPGGVCLSRQVMDQVRTKLPYNFEKLSVRNLKGVGEPVEVFRVVLPWKSASFEGSRTGVTRLAVLPFANISPDPNDEYFADGLTEELITTLSHVRGVEVIARTSVIPYKATTKPLAHVGAELGVSTVLEGSVRKAGNRLRITAQLVDVGSQGHRWASTYDRTLDDIFAVQSDVASNVAKSLSQEVLKATPAGETSSVDAYTLYLRAMHLYHEETVSEVREAIQLLEEAVKLDPSFGRAYAGLAQCWGWLAQFDRGEWSSVAEKGYPAARRALELAPESAEAHEAMAQAHMLMDEGDGAITEALLAIRLNPNLAHAYRTLAALQCNQGHMAEGLEAFKRSYELDPLSVQGATEYAWMAQILGHEREAFDVLERISRVRAGNPEVLDALAEYHLLRRDWPAAARVLEPALQQFPQSYTLRTEQARLLALTGHEEEAREVLRGIERDADPITYQNASLFVLAALNDTDGVLAVLMSLADSHAWPYPVLIHPAFAGARSDPRFQQFLAKVGLKE